MTDLTQRQKDALKVIASRQSQHRTGPSIREVAAAMGIAGNAAQRHIDGLRRAGQLEPESGFGLVCVQPNTPATRVRAPLAKPGGRLL